MNKFAKFAIFLAIGMAFSACDFFDFDDDYIGGDFKKLVKKEQEWSDTVKVIDNWGLKDAYDERLYSHKPENFYFEASGDLNEINIDLRIECDDNVLDSLKIGKNTYWDVLEFDATSADENSCNFDKFYVAARDGLLRIELQDTIVIERRP